MTAQDIAAGAPTWVYGLLVVLILLGVRRLKAREVPLFVALLPIIAFGAWSIIGAVNFSNAAAATTAVLAWVGGAAIGVASAFVFPEPAATRLPGGRAALPASKMPLILYMLVFAARFACGAWAAIVPAMAVIANGIGVAISALMAARLVTWMTRWRVA